MEIKTPEDLVEQLSNVDMQYCDDIGLNSNKFGIGFLADISNSDENVIGHVVIRDKEAKKGNVSILRSVTDTEIIFEDEEAAEIIRLLYREDSTERDPFDVTKEDVDVGEMF